MGIYSKYRLGVLRGRNIVLVREKQQIIQSLFDDPLIDPFKEMMEAITLDGQTKQEAKWYDYDKHLLAFSKKYADLSFVLGLSDWNDKYGKNEYFFLFNQGESQFHEPKFLTDDLIFGDLHLPSWFIFQPNTCVFFDDLDDFLANIIQQHQDDLTSITIPFKRFDDLFDIENQLKRDTIFKNTSRVTDNLEKLFPHFHDIRIALKVTFPSNQFSLFLEISEAHIFEVTF
ncbi:hypothetical protein F966_00931 [Acinetobacter higginsii]|uniref:Uncharacterized protein n=1 Tax=Acinetobacter higginsii TaxID=70347 RepID=N8WGQ5_9GAMM|nr:hypothetical protein [Acinetobacter higginsii]ENV11146.1 hypothetical protein F966_00931 [Acinetobacter higginsii]MDO3664596.1 hypothetical protein [Acinetobacter higginsii]